MSKLFSSYTLGNSLLTNKVVMAPMTRSRAIDNVPNSLMAKYYEQRSDAGLIITEGTSPSPNGLGYSRIPGIYNDEQVKAWKEVTTAVHNAGGRIFVQLMHTGRVSHPDNLPEGAKIVAPSPLAAPDQMWTDQNGMQDFPVPAEMTADDIQKAIQEYVKASQNAIDAGFDGVELHAANGYLLEQFINPITNKREDEYGGSVENRLRFVLEVAQQVTDAIGNSKVGIRISPYGVFNGLGSFDSLNETYEKLAKRLSEIGIIYIHTVDHESMGAPKVPNEMRNIIRANFNGAIILSGGYDKERAEKDLAEDKGELVAFGRPYISNPDLVQRMEHGQELAEPNPDTFYTPGEEGYTDYPALEKVN